MARRNHIRNMAISLALKGNTNGTTHGLSKTRAYQAWQNMLSRCYCSKTFRFDRYGGRGIRVCDKWRTFLGFYGDMGEPPAGLTLDRIDNNGNYEPGNCRWATWPEQIRNRSVRLYEWNGMALTLNQWAEHLGIRYKTLHRRLAKGWTTDEAFSLPLLKTKTTSAHGSVSL